MKIQNLIEYKSNKEGRHTPKYVLDEAIESIEDIADVIIVVRTKKGTLEVSHNYQNEFQIIGMLEVAKTFLSLNVEEH